MPLSAPVALLKVAQPGLLDTEKVSVVPLGAVAVGANMYFCPAVTLVMGVPEIVGGVEVPLPDEPLPEEPLPDEPLEPVDWLTAPDEEAVLDAPGEALPPHALSVTAASRATSGIASWRGGKLQFISVAPK